VSEPKPPVESSEQTETTEPTEPAISPAVQNKLADLDELGQQIQRRIRSNQRFLDRFLDEDFVDDEDLPDPDEPEDLEEL